MTRGLLVASIRSGSGKTTVSLGLMRSLRRRGLSVAPFKCGPDYIDPAFHARAAGRQGLNLDSWAMPPAEIASLAALTADRADVVVGEALMGLFDGVPAPAGRTGSSADVAAALGLPVILVHDVSGQSGSAAAVVLGARMLDPRVTVAGVILNKVGSDRHRRLATAAIEATGTPVIGALPRSDDVRLPERHLGLVQASETEAVDQVIDGMADWVDAHVDVTRCLSLTGTMLSPPGQSSSIRPPGQRIAVAQDTAFSFLYPHLALAWRTAGADILPFSPLADEAPDPRADACWLPGGYPELHAGRLAGNRRFVEGLRAFAASRPVHGECGGYMVLGDAIVDADGTRHEMAGLLGLTTSFAVRRMHLGYRRVTLAGHAPFGATGDSFRGHEFHYATVTERAGDAPFATVEDAYGGAAHPDGSRRGTVTGSFFHLISRG